jgi:hypothetical protein
MLVVAAESFEIRAHHDGSQFGQLVDVLSRRGT